MKITMLYEKWVFASFALSKIPPQFVTILVSQRQSYFGHVKSLQIGIVIGCICGLKPKNQKSWRWKLFLISALWHKSFPETSSITMTEHRSKTPNTDINNTLSYHQLINYD